MAPLIATHVGVALKYSEIVPVWLFFVGILISEVDFVSNLIVHIVGSSPINATATAATISLWRKFFPCRLSHICMD